MTDAKALLKMMVELGASDLFLTTEAVPHIKVDGVPRPAAVPALQPGKSLGGEIWFDLRSPLTHIGSADFRGNITPRYFPTSAKFPP